MDENDFESSLEDIAALSEQMSVTAPSSQENGIELLMDVLLQITVEVGRTRLSIQDLLQLGQGSVIELEKLAGEPLDIFVNGKIIARGEAVIVNEKFGVRLTEILSPEDIS